MGRIYTFLGGMSAAISSLWRFVTLAFTWLLKAIVGERAVMVRGFIKASYERYRARNLFQRRIYKEQDFIFT